MPLTSTRVGLEDAILRRRMRTWVREGRHRIGIGVAAGWRNVFARSENLGLGHHLPRRDESVDAASQSGETSRGGCLRTAELGEDDS